MKLFIFSLLVMLSSCNLAINEKPKIVDAGISNLPKIQGSFQRAKYLVEDQFFTKKCEYLGEFSGKAYYEVVEIDFSSEDGTYRQLYSISEDYLNLRDASCGHGLLSNIFSIETKFNYSFVNEADFNGVLVLSESFNSSEASLGDVGVLPILAQIAIRDGATVCNTNWSLQPLHTAIDVTNRLFCPIQSLATALRYNHVTLNSRLELLMGEFSNSENGSTRALAPTKMSQGMLRTFAYDAVPVIQGDEDLFLSRRHMWGPLMGSGSEVDYGVWEYVQFDTPRSGRIIERYYDRDTNQDVVSIDSQFTLNFENRLSSSPLAYNVRLNITSSVLHVLNTQGAQLVNDLGMCDVSGATAGQVVNILGLEPLYHCSFFTQGTIYSKIEMINHHRVKLGFPKITGGWGDLPSERADRVQNMVEFSL